MNHQQKIHQLNDTHLREVNMAQHVIMMVVGDNIVCAHKALNGKILFVFLLTEPLMKVHFINLVKTFLVKFTGFPHLLCQFVEFLGIVIANEQLDIIQLIIALDARKHIKKIELGRIENSWLYAFHNF